MKLQVNNSGAWKNVLTFGIEHIEHVKVGAADLALCASLADAKVGWRILDGTERVLLMYGQQRGWHTPAWMRGHEIVP